MRALPPIEMQELRRIADRNWDALTSRDLQASGTDRFDAFLARGAVMLWDGACDTTVGDYFVNVSIEQLGVDTGSGIRERAQLFARAIRGYLETAPQPAH